KCFSVTWYRLNGSLKSNLRGIKRTRNEFGHHCRSFLSGGRIVFQREVACAMPHFHILACDLHIEIVELAVERILGRIKTQRIADFSIRDRRTYGALKIVVEIKSPTARSVSESNHDIRQRIRGESPAPSRRIRSF